MFKFLNRYGSWIVAIVAAIIAVIATIHFYNLHQILAYNDARSRLNIARRVTDNLTPGIVQLGTIWLPLDQFLMVPLTISAYLWRTGLAGSIVSGAAFVLGAVFVYKIVFLLTKQMWLSFFGALLFILNLNVLYLQSTAMTELPMLATLAGTVYFIIRWLQTRHTLDLSYAGAFAFLTALNRYEGWFMIVVCAAIVYIDTRLTNGTKARAQGQTLIYATVGMFGVFLWFLWNLVFWGNPLYFLTGENGQYSPSGHHTPTRHHLLTTLDTMWRAMGFNLGFALLWLTAAAIVVLLFRRANRKGAVYVIALLFAPLAFNLLALFMGVTTISAGTLRHSVNLRYAISAVPLAAVVIPYAIAQLPKLVKPVIVLISLGCLLYIPNGAYDSAVYGGRSMSASQLQFAATFKADYKGGVILASSASPFSQIEQAVGIPFKNYVSEGNGTVWKQTLKNPQKRARYILMSTRGGPVHDAFMERMAVYNQYYRVIYQQKDGTEVLELDRDVLNANTQATTPMVSHAVVTTPATTTGTVQVIVKSGDSETGLVLAEIQKIDVRHTLSVAQVVFVEHQMVSTLGNDNLIYPGQVIRINTDTLTDLINQSHQLSPAQLVMWQYYASDIVY